MKWRMTGAFVALLLACSVQRAQAGDGVVALQTADPSCPDGSGNFYVDCGNGTVTDNRTGLVWLANADCLAGTETWFTAMEFVAGLSDKPATSAAAAHDCGLSDGSSRGEWRLPSIEEWEAMVEYADDVLGCSPTITNNSGNGCWDQACVTGGACSFSGVVSSFYWSSTTAVNNPAGAWVMGLSSGDASAGGGKTGSRDVWPVRGGQ